MLTDCKLCKAEKAVFPKVEADPDRRDCCARRSVQYEPDFMEQKSRLHEVVTAAGHVCLFLPKFHPELNFIEMVC